MTDQPTTHKYTNHAGGYYVCSHTGCSKKAWTHDDHDCCGKPWHHPTNTTSDNPDDDIDFATTAALLIIGLVGIAATATYRRLRNRT